MRIYNGKDSLVCLPLNANQRISIDAHSVSGDFLPSTEFITMLIAAYNTNELALIVSSSFEINMCANVVGAVNYVVQSLDEAVKRFAIPKEEKKVEVSIKKTEPKVNPEPEEVCVCGNKETCENCEKGSEDCSCDKPVETPQEETQEVVEEEVSKPKKKKNKKKD